MFSPSDLDFLILAPNTTDNPSKVTIIGAIPNVLIPANAVSPANPAAPATEVLLLDNAPT